MTREKAAKILNRFFSCIIFPRCSGKRMLKEAVDTAFEALKQPEQKKGKWIDARDHCGEFLCSNCHETNINNSYKYCPYCGAEMGEDR